MTSKSELSAILRRIAPERRLVQLVRRADRDLPFLHVPIHRAPPLLLDTTVYIDQLQGRTGPELEDLLRRAVVRHSPVARAELALALGRLDPSHPATPAALRQIRQAIERTDRRSILPPGDDDWLAAAVLAGTLARTQGYRTGERTRLLNDALLLLTARKHGCTLLSRNVADLDLLTQLIEDAPLLLYRVPPQARP